MRRKDREITDIEEIRDIIEKCKVCRLAMHSKSKEVSDSKRII